MERQISLPPKSGKKILIKRCKWKSQIHHESLKPFHLFGTGVQQFKFFIVCGYKQSFFSVGQCDDF